MLHLPGNTLGARWHLDIPAIGGPDFCSARAHGAVVSTRAAIATFRRHTLRVWSWGWWPSWWDTRPIAAHLEDARHAMRRDGAVHQNVLPKFEQVSTSRRPQAVATRIITDGLCPERVIEAATRRTAQLALEMAAGQIREGSCERWRLLGASLTTM